MKFFFITILLLQSSVFCQFTSMSVAGINFKLGMSFETALRNCEVCGKNLHRVGSGQYEKYFIVEDTLEILDEMSNIAGSVSFLEGKLKSVQKFWGSYQEGDLRKFLSDLYAILNKSNQLEINSLIRLTDYYEPDMKAKSIEIHLQNKTISIDFLEGYEINLTESID